MKQIKTPVLDIAYETRGSDGMPPVILLHGFPDDARTWDDVTEGLADAGFQTFAPYMRGYGKTSFLEKELRRSGQTVALMQDTIDFADALGIQQFILVGHDWGARAAYPAAMLHPDRVKAMVTLAAGYGTGVPAKDAKEPMPIEQAEAYWYQWYFQNAKGKEALESDRDCFCKELWRRWSPTWKDQKAAYKKTAGSFDNDDFVETAIHAYRYRWQNEIGDSRYAALEAKLEEPPKISVPTILLHGSEDGASLPKSSEGKDCHFSGKYERRILDGIGHFIQREDPKAVIEAVLKIAES